jgi:hypothetical protein
MLFHGALQLAGVERVRPYRLLVNQNQAPRSQLEEQHL